MKIDYIHVVLNIYILRKSLVFHSYTTRLEIGFLYSASQIFSSIVCVCMYIMYIAYIHSAEYKLLQMGVCESFSLPLLWEYG